MSLYQLTKEFEKATYDLLFESDDTNERLFIERIDKLVIDLEAKRANCCAYVKNIRAEQEALENEITRMKARVKSLANAEKRMLDYIKFCMREESWTNGVHKISFRESEETIIDDKNLIPEAYMRVIIKSEPDKTQIKNDIKQGAVIPEARLQKNINVQIK